MSRKFREVSTLQTASAYAHDLSYSVCNLNKVKGDVSETTTTGRIWRAMYRFNFTRWWGRVSIKDNYDDYLIA